MTGSGAQDAPILFELQHPAAVITLNRPARGNALTPELQEAFVSFLNQASRDDLVHFVVLRACGKFFCTGMDLSASGSSLSGDNNKAYEAGRAFFEKLESFAKPCEYGRETATLYSVAYTHEVVAVAQGNAYGGGCGIFFSADVRLAAAGTKFQLTEVTRGLVPALISPTIIREWGPQLAREAMLTARPVSAEELQSMHAIARVFKTPEEGEALLLDIVQMLKRGGPKAMQRSKALVRTQAPTGLSLQPPRELPAAQAQTALKAAFLEMMAPSEEAVAGIQAFRESKGKKDVDWLGLYKSKL